MWRSFFFLARGLGVEGEGGFVRDVHPDVGLPVESRRLLSGVGVVLDLRVGVQGLRLRPVLTCPCK